MSAYVVYTTPAPPGVSATPVTDATPLPISGAAGAAQGIQGAVAVGSPASGENPVLIGYQDSAGNVQAVGGAAFVHAMPVVGFGNASNADGVSNNSSAPNVGGAYYPLEIRPFLYRGDGTWDRARTPVKFIPLAAVSVTAGTPVAAWTPQSGKKFRLLGFMLSLSVAGSVILKDAAAEFLRTPLMAAGVGLASPRMGNGYLSAAANDALNLDVTASGTVSGFLFGCEE